MELQAEKEAGKLTDRLSATWSEWEKWCLPALAGNFGEIRRDKSRLCLFFKFYFQIINCRS